MSSDIKISEAEFSVYCNKLSTYGRFLSESVNSYIGMLDEVLRMGIKDKEITEAINELKTSVKPIATHIESSVSSVRGTSNAFLSDVKKEDQYTYSDDDMSTLFSILSKFL